MNEPPLSASVDAANSIETAADDTAFDPPRSIAPTPQLSTRGFFIALALVCLIPLTVLSTYAVMFGKATERSLPVSATIDHRLRRTPPGQTQGVEDVIVIENEADFAITSLYVDLNGQFFMYIDQPLAASEKLVLPQDGFVNRNGQRWVPGNYPIDVITVMGKLPSGARGVTEIQYQ